MRILCFILLSFTLLATNAYGQIWIDNFDGSNTAAFTTNQTCNNVPGGGDLFYFGVVCNPGAGCGNEIDPSLVGYYNGASGSFLGALDTDNAGGCGVPMFDAKFAEWTGISIASCTPDDILYLCFDVAEGDENPGFESWDSPSFVNFSVSIDGGPSINLASIEDISGFQSSPGFNLDCDNFGDASSLITNFFTTYCFQIPGHGNTITTRIDIGGLNEDDEDIAIDNVGIYCTGDPSTLPGQLLLSCGSCGIDGDCDGIPVTVDCNDGDSSNTKYRSIQYKFKSTRRRL